MKISIIMASYLGDYPNAATNREEKFRRAVASVMAQTYSNCELIVVADGCEITTRVCSKIMIDYGNIMAKLNCPNLRMLSIPRNEGFFSGQARNFGLEEARGEIVCYLDTDDYLQLNTIENIAKNFPAKCDWVYYNDFVAENAEVTKVRQRENILQLGRIGTSGIAHRADMPVEWESGYGHDWTFIEQLMKVSNDYTKIQPVGYVVCHIPGVIDY